MNLLEESDSSTEEDVTFIHILLELRRPKIFYERLHPMVFYLDDEFKKRYRFTKPTVMFLEHKLRSVLGYVDMRNNPVPVVDQILVTLRFYATGSFQTVSGDLAGVSQSTVCRIVHKVSIAIASWSKDFIKMPSNAEEIARTKRKFYIMGGIPNIISLIDGCHIPIQSPGGENSEIFRNRKGWYSINVQIACDADNKITDIVSRWHGSTHDQTIFNFSLLKIRFERGEFGNAIMLGDSGYACRTYLLTPLREPRTPQQTKYNKEHKFIRHNVECCIGIWKRRFPAIQTRMRIKVENCLTVIVATAVLHNIAVMRNEPEPTAPEIIINPRYSQNIVPAIYRSQTATDTAVRNLIIQQM